MNVGMAGVALRVRRYCSASRDGLKGLDIKDIDDSALNRAFNRDGGMSAERKTFSVAPRKIFEASLTGA